MTRRMLTAAMAVFFVLGLAGCETIDKAIESAEQNPRSAQLITSQITKRFVALDDSDPVERAERLQTVAGRLAERAEDQEASLDELSRLADEEVEAYADSMTPADRELLEAAIQRAETTISELIDEGVVDADETASITTLMHWIDVAAQEAKAYEQ